MTKLNSLRRDAVVKVLDEMMNSTIPLKVEEWVDRIYEALITPPAIVEHATAALRGWNNYIGAGPSNHKKRFEIIDENTTMQDIVEAVLLEAQRFQQEETDSLSPWQRPGMSFQEMISKIEAIAIYLKTYIGNPSARRRADQLGEIVSVLKYMDNRCKLIPKNR